MMLSECCGAPPWGEEEYGICGDCKEHCEFYDDEEEEEEPGRDNLAKRTRDDVFSPQQQAIIDRLMEEAPDE